jgi:hypothetical protein
MGAPPAPLRSSRWDCEVTMERRREHKKSVEVLAFGANGC